MIWRGNIGSEVDNNEHAVIFDMDGTLIDPLIGIANSYSHLCTTLGLQQMSDEEVWRLIGPPLQDALTLHFQFDSDDELDAAVTIFRDFYSTQGIYEFRKYPGIDDLLQNLRQSGFDLCIATNKPAAFARQIVHDSGWDGIFSVVGGATLDGATRHKKDIIAQVLEQLPDYQRADLYVGDRPEDASGAHPNGLSFVGVSWGYSTQDKLLSAGAVEVATSMDQLATTINKLTIGQT